ncbi:MAG TPA: YihY/virulence factor BrkB family protein [Candidatus Acidoferrales bacterium]|nr:YihY/virulence factor BrkB family protein [Candidatus Acidoferrales bacterium]
MPGAGKTIVRSLRRVFPDCQIAAQAVAFSMFLAFFPFLLFGLGVLSGTGWGATAVREMWLRLQVIVPPASSRLVESFMSRHTTNAWQFVLLGLFGTVIVGTQVMIGLMEGFQIVERDSSRPSYWVRQLRALALLCLTIIPWLAVVMLTMFGKQVRNWLIVLTGHSVLVRLSVALLYFAFVLPLAVLVLMVVYRVGRPEHREWQTVFPGAAVATALWWVVDILFGTYVRHVPYNEVYGGVAAAIGLLIWMYLTAVIVFLGAAYNAELRAR